MCWSRAQSTSTMTCPDKDSRFGRIRDPELNFDLSQTLTTHREWAQSSRRARGRTRKRVPSTTTSSSRWTSRPLPRRSKCVQLSLHGLRLTTEIIQATCSGSQQLLRAGSLTLQLINHPDKNPDRVEEATKLFADLQQAYEVSAMLRQQLTSRS